MLWGGKDGGGKITVIQQVNVSEFGSTELCRVLLTGSGSKANLLDGGCTTGTVDTAKCLP